MQTQYTHIASIHQNGWTPLHAACQSDNPDIPGILLENGAKIDAKNQVSQSPKFMVFTQ